MIIVGSVFRVGSFCRRSGWGGADVYYERDFDGECEMRDFSAWDGTRIMVGLTFHVLSVDGAEISRIAARTVFFDEPFREQAAQ